VGKSCFYGCGLSRNIGQKLYLLSIRKQRRLLQRWKSTRRFYRYGKRTGLSTDSPPIEQLDSHGFNLYGLDANTLHKRCRDCWLDYFRNPFINDRNTPDRCKPIRRILQRVHRRSSHLQQGVNCDGNSNHLPARVCRDIYACNGSHYFSQRRKLQYPDLGRNADRYPRRRCLLHNRWLDTNSVIDPVHRNHDRPKLYDGKS
jgi:hypothetical protein